MRLIAIDQSLAKCAWTVFEDKEVIAKGIIKTGAKTVKKKYEGVAYFDTPEEQIKFICDCVSGIAAKFLVKEVVFEGLSFGSAGNATRNLAGLYFSLCDRLMTQRMINRSSIYSVAPTALKAFSRRLLPEDEQKTPTGKGVKMDKKMMIRVVDVLEGEEYLSPFKMSGKDVGKDDLADSYLLGKYYWEEIRGS